MFRMMLAAAAMAASLGSAAQAQELWRGSRAQMTVDEVRRQIPEALPVTGPRMDGADLRLRVTGFQLEDTDFKADFYFNSAGLQAVALRPVQPQSAVAVMTAAENLIPKLGAKYGQPYDCIIHENTRSQVRTSCKWMSGTTRIMVFGGFSIGNGVLELLYETTGSDSENL